MAPQREPFSFSAPKGASSHEFQGISRESQRFRFRYRLATSIPWRKNDTWEVRKPATRGASPRVPLIASVQKRPTQFLHARADYTDLNFNALPLLDCNTGGEPRYDADNCAAQRVIKQHPAGPSAYAADNC